MGILSVAIICNFQSIFFFFFYIAAAVDVISLYDLKYRAMQSIRNEGRKKINLCRYLKMRIESLE
jgi:hypothetical protein